MIILLVMNLITQFIIIMCAHVVCNVFRRIFILQTQKKKEKKNFRN